MEQTDPEGYREVWCRITAKGGREAEGLESF
jgi:hypothetical protein